ncbi:Metallo-dependent phosphatase-like protein [Cladorrhinum sp. PSN332]|nr:Metallo-dependent phosphatase-like protein [Cladorrhinum sp. PSN332]
MDPSSAAIQQTRRTRIVCISDTHNSTPKLPKGDVLIHAGDLTNKGSYSELSKAIQWLEKADFEKKIVIAGNHDLTLDLEFYSAHGHVIHNQDSQDPEKCLSLLKSSRTITYLCHGSATIRLTDPKGPRTEFTVFGSPYSPRVGLWAFSYDREDKSSPGIQISSGPGQEPRLGPGAAELWASIPLDTDIVVSHTPPYGYCDASLGCEELRTRLSQVRPRLHICGHVHHGRGAKRVRWDVSGVSQVNNGLPEPTVENWTDPSPDISSAKISLIDLTARGGNRPLDFYDQAPRERLQREPGKSGPGQQGLSLKPSCARLSSGFEGDDSVWAGPEAELGDYQPITTEAFGSDTQHLGAEPRGRLGRRETCIINCAIVANSWPHTGGKRFNKPIVVDLGLPVWR